MDPSEITAAVEAARRAARGAGVAPESADVALAEIDAAAAKGGAAFDLWLVIDRQIGKTNQNPTLHRLLKELQHDVQEKTIAAEIRRLTQISEQAPDRGWREWVITQVRGIAAFRFEFCVRVGEACKCIPAVGQPTPDELRAAVRHMHQRRWVEAYQVLSELGELEFLPDHDRAAILFIRGHLSLLWLNRNRQAQRLFDKAESLKPNSGLVKFGLGDFWRAQQNLERAISCWRCATKATPAEVMGFVRQGEHYESQNQLKDAEQWYRKAIAAEPGDSGGYTSLFKLYGRAELFEQHQHELQPLMELAVAVGDRSGQYDQYLALGSVYEQNKRYQQACEWYEAAIGLDETRPDGYSALGGLREKEGRANDALAAFQRATDAAPECPHGGAWELAGYYARQGDWGKAESAYLRVPQAVPEWAALVRAQIAKAKSKAGNEAEAERDLLGALRADKENESAKSVLNEIATDHYTSGDEGAARLIYDQVLDILGDAYRGDYHNALGNLAYWRGDNADAAEAYRQAIDASLENPVYRRNLAGALRNLKDYRASEQALDAAHRIDRDERTYNHQIALLKNAEGNDYYERGDFWEAREKYEESTRFDHSLAVVHSNLARAWERLQQPGAEVEALDKAIESFERASKLLPEEGHQREIERLQRKKKLAPIYGLKPLSQLQPFATPIAVEIAADLVAFVSDDQKDELSATAARLIGSMRERLQKLSGVVIPGVRIRDNPALGEGNYVFLLNDIPLASGGIDLSKRFFPGPGDSLAALAIPGETASSQQTGCEGLWIDRADEEKLTGVVPKLWELFEYPMRHLEHVLRHHLPELLGHQEVIGILEREIPAAAAVLRRRPKQLSRLTDVCRGLAMEQVPLTPFLEIYNAFLSATDSRPQDIVESIRSLPQFRDRLPGNDGQRPVFTLSPHFEAELARCLYPGSSGRILAIEPRACQTVLAAIDNSIGAGAPGAIIVGDGELRPFLRRLVEAQLPDTPILSRCEARPIGEAKFIELDGQDEPANPDFHLSGSAPGDDAEAGSSANSAPIPAEMAIVVFLPRGFGQHEGSALHERIWRGIAALLPGGFGQAATKRDDQSLAEPFSQMRERLYDELGVLLPQVRIQHDDNLPDDLFRFRLNQHEFPAARGLENTQISTNRPDINPEILTTENVSQAVEAAARWNAAMFQTVELTQYSLDVLNESFPDLVRSALNQFNVHQICAVLRSLLDEEISVKDLRSILEGMLAVNGVTDIDPKHYIVFTPPAENLCLVASGRGMADLTASDYANFVRSWRKRYISYKYARGSESLPALLLDSQIENRIRERAARPLTEADKTRLTNAVRDALGRNSEPPIPVILTDMDIRRELWKLLAAKFPKLGILSYQDLALDTNIRPLGRISWEFDHRVMPV